MKLKDIKIWHSSKLLVAELVVVFLGVYGAFWVENYREEQGRDERTKQVILVLQQDLKDFIKVSGAFNKKMEEGLLDWSRAREQGKKVPPYVFRIYGAKRPPQSTWETVREERLSDLLHPNLIYELGFYYNELEGWGDEIVRYSTFTDTVVLPLLKSGSASFYSEDNSRMLPQFEAHMERLSELKRLSEDLVLWSACLHSRLESAEKSTEGCRTDVGITVM